MSKKTAYIAVTALACLAVLPGAIMNIAQPEMIVEMVGKLGLPMYLLTLIGIWKLLGVAALSLPPLSRFREWAYAGFFFDLTGAAYTHAASDDMAGVAPPLFILALIMTSYVLRGKVAAEAAVKRAA